MRFHKPFFLLFSILVQSPLRVFSANPPFTCDPSDPSSQKYAFCKLTLPIKQRVQDLVSRLTLEEKIAQLGDVSPPIERLGVPGYKWWSESLHGVSSGGRGIHFDGPIKTSTIFPQVILIAAAFNPLLTSKYAASYVRGLQGDPYQDGHSAQVLQASACCKHFTQIAML